MLTQPRLSVTLDNDADVPVYLQIIRQIELAIEGGNLADGELLPPIRRLARDLKINQMTVVKAYRTLSDKGLIEGKGGGGTRVRRPVARTDPSSRPATRSGRGGKPDAAVLADPLEAMPDIAMRMAELSLAPGVMALTNAYPAMSQGERGAFARCLDEVIERGSATTFAYASPEGSPGLRGLLSHWVGVHGATVSPERLIVTSGAQQAIDIAVRTHLEPGDTVIVEAPTYFGALDAFRARGVRIVGLPLSDDGVAASALDEACRQHSPKAFYTIPNVHNPTGITTPEVRRRELLQVASSHGCAIFEDDYCPELASAGKAAETYLSLAQADERVYYFRSLGKLYLPGMRLGFLITPRESHARAISLKRLSDLHGPSLVQDAAELFLGRKQALTEAIKEQDEVFKKTARMRDELEGLLPDGCAIPRVDGGFNLWISLPRAVANQALYYAAVGHGVSFAPGSLFVQEGGNQSTGIRVSVGSLDGASLKLAAARLSSALHSVLDQQRSASRYLI